MKTLDVVKTTYPKLAHILDEDTLAEISCIESKEREFIQKTANSLQQYLRALYLKSMRYLRYGTDSCNIMQQEGNTGQNYTFP